MIGIKAISTFIPDNFIDNVAQAESFDQNERFVTNKIGSTRLPYMPNGSETSDLAVEAALRLEAVGVLKLKSIDALVVVTQNGDGNGLPHTAAIVHGKLGLKSHVAAFDVSLGCSGYVYGLSIIRGLMEQAGLENGLLITADPYSKIIDRGDRSTTLLFGDAATATYLTRDGVWRFGRPLLETDGIGGSYLKVENGKFSMNGRQVFNFALTKVPVQIREYLDREKVKLEDVDVFCIHQGSASIVEAIAKSFPEVSERFVSDIKHTGNTVSSSIPLLLENLIRDKTTSRILISGFGVGLSWATNMIYREV